MQLIDHVSVGVPDIVLARAFYDKVLAALGRPCLSSGPSFVTYGAERVEFLLLLPFDGKPATAGNGTHICFCAASKEAVVAFHRLGIEAGGTDAGQPGVRDAYPFADAYAAYVRDPFGNKLEAICGGFSSTNHV